LYTILAEEALPGGVGFENCFGRKSLADGQEGDVVGVAARAVGSSGDAVAD
jgi:hypothetical protein